MDWCDRYKLGRLVLVKTEMTEALYRHNDEISINVKEVNFNLLDQCTEYVPVINLFGSIH